MSSQTKPNKHGTRPMFRGRRKPDQQDKHTKMVDELEKTVDGQDDEYNSSEDEDFNPNTVEAPPDDELSSSEDEAPQPKKAPKKRKKAQVDAEELDSGDEATITELRKSKKPKADDDDSGGEGGLIKTRAQRRAECGFPSHHGRVVLTVVAGNKSVRNTKRPTSSMSRLTWMPCGLP